MVDLYLDRLDIRNVSWCERAFHRPFIHSPARSLTRPVYAGVIPVLKMLSMYTGVEQLTRSD
jgi:hypothetical protein